MNIKRLTLAVILGLTAAVLFSQDLSIDATGMTQDDVLMELKLDWDKYEGELVEINDMLYVELGIKDKFGFYKASKWFREAYRLRRTDFMYRQDINFLFNPASDDREARKWVMKATGKYYTNPLTTDMIIKPLSHTLNTGHTLYFVIIKSMTFNNTTYTGSLPDRITE
jgi:hypothetical protein